MKKALLVLAIITAYYSSSFAMFSGVEKKEFGFKYQYAGKSYEFKQVAGSYEEALEKVAVACFNKFKANGRMSEESGLELIDVCVNPRAL